MIDTTTIYVDKWLIYNLIRLCPSAKILMRGVHNDYVEVNTQEFEENWSKITPDKHVMRHEPPF